MADGIDDDNDLRGRANDQTIMQQARLDAADLTDDERIAVAQAMQASSYSPKVQLWIFKFSQKIWHTLWKTSISNDRRNNNRTGRSRTEEHK